MGSDGESGVVEGKLIKKLPHGRISYIDMALRDGSFFVVSHIRRLLSLHMNDLVHVAVR
jgi:hypothetical protein